MNLDMAADQPYELDQWSAWFKSELAPSDLDAPGVLAFMHHFAYLGILEPAGGDLWKLCGMENNHSSGPLRDVVRDHLEALTRTEAGFAISYFLGQRHRVSQLPLKGSHNQQPRSIPDAGKTSNRENASDFSNLQIVIMITPRLPQSNTNALGSSIYFLGSSINVMLGKHPPKLGLTCCVAHI